MATNAMCAQIRCVQPASIEQGLALGQVTVTNATRVRIAQPGSTPRVVVDFRRVHALLGGFLTLYIRAGARDLVPKAPRSCTTV